jgi:asparagine synthase (glutamine-hydrolysing)
MSAALWRDGFRSPARHIVLEGGALVVSGEKTPVSLHGGEGIAAAVVGWPEWRGDELHALARRDGHGAALAAAYARHGRRLFDQVGGPFAIALIDTRRGIACAAIDRLAAQTMTFADIGPDGFVFASTADGVRAYPGVASEIDPQAIFDFLYFGRVSAPATIYKAVRKLLPGQYVWREAGRSEAVRYWAMPYVKARGGDVGALAAELRGLVDEAVGHAIDGYSAERVGAFLSGGVDSSTVVGVLSKRLGKVHAFSIGFDAEGYDEMVYAKDAARHFGAIHHEYYITPRDVVELLPKLAATYDEPFANASAVPAYYCARLARDHGIDLMLAGDGGDELFAGNARYARQGLFEIYGRVPAWLRRGVIEPLAFGIPFGASIMPLRRARSYIEQANTPMPDRIEVNNMYAGIAPTEIFEPDIAGNIDPGGPRATLHDVYRRTSSPALLHRMLHVDQQLTLGDDDLRKVSRTCAMAGVAVRFPLLDDAVAEFSARIPPRLALKGRQLRYFFKYAYKDFLPTSTLTKSKHGFGLPTAHWLKSHAPLEALARDTLAALKRRGLFRPAFIDRMAAAHREADVRRYKDYFGDQVWSLMVLELWLAAHEAAPVA